MQDTTQIYLFCIFALNDSNLYFDVAYLSPLYLLADEKKDINSLLRTFFPTAEDTHHTYLLEEEVMVDPYLQEEQVSYISAAAAAVTMCRGIVCEQAAIASRPIKSTKTPPEYKRPPGPSRLSPNSPH
mmetsp:Transcript_27213/g.38707  ORF Transcript_27213/g.38707 Transcript_27213/m.38707 type:complete len:128 (+) Transcript_27213:165-548(+)